MTDEQKTVEQELLEATGFKPKKSYRNRQDYLAALVRAVSSELTDDQFENLSDEAADWCNEAVKAMESKDEINDFEGADTDVEEDDSEPEEPQPPIEEPENYDHNDEPADDEPDEEAAADAQAEADNEQAEAEAAAKPTKKKKEPVKAKPKGKPVSPSMYTTAEKDRFGVVMGTKVHEAVKMYERGTTSRELKEKLEGRFYNILTKLVKDGHKVEKSPEGVFTLTHKDDVAKDSKKK